MIEFFNLQSKLIIFLPCCVLPFCGLFWVSICSELGFNSIRKGYNEDRSVVKRKLTEAHQWSSERYICQFCCCCLKSERRVHIKTVLRLLHSPPFLIFCCFGALQNNFINQLLFTFACCMHVFVVSLRHMEYYSIKSVCAHTQWFVWAPAAYIYIKIITNLSGDLVNIISSCLCKWNIVLYGYYRTI